MLLLIREVDQPAKLFDKRLGFQIKSLGGSNGLLMLAVSKPQDLNEPALTVVGIPIHVGLLIDLEQVAPDPRQRLPKPDQKARMFRPLLLGNDVAVGLQEHSTPIVRPIALGSNPENAEAPRFSGTDLVKPRLHLGR